MQCLLLKSIRIDHEDGKLKPKHVEPKLWPFLGGGRASNTKYNHLRWSAQQEKLLQKRRSRVYRDFRAIPRVFRGFKYLEI